ncbi:hypothetical protein BT63DRAFT_203334 [Microthyrium microscopicum]|uniref:Complex I intermediate-associated protein 84, mitochondrial n=1 Tax=Microthyrium microscopicum TaxID=703497 RepID=A0A6A6UFB2_9PEZI|nr:hypothetical protein BT63DRAFT_203334 [Microthyrium microscopicum]
MQTSLTRQVFRRILANESILHRDLRIRHRYRPLYASISRSASVQHSQRRYLFESLRTKTSSLALSREEINLRRHIKALEEARMYLTINYRTAPKKDLAKSFVTFLRECEASQELVTDFHTGILLKVFQFLKSDELGDVAVTVEDAQLALTAMSNFDYGKSDSGLTRNNPVFQDSYWILANQLSQFIRKTDVDGKVDHDRVTAQEVLCYVQSGYSNIAHSLMPGVRDLACWKAFVRSQYNHPEGLTEAWATFLATETTPNDSLLAIFTQGFVAIGNPELAKQVIEHPLFLTSENCSLRPAADVLSACSQTKDETIARSVISKVDKLLSDRETQNSEIGDRKAWFDTLVLFETSGKLRAAAKATVERLQAQGYEPDIETINILVQNAYKTKSPALASDYLELAESLDIRPNGYTLLPRVEFQLQTGDLDGALKTWDHILYELEPLDVNDMPAPMEIFLRALSRAGNPNPVAFDELMDNHGRYTRRFQPETLVEIVEYYLRGEDYESAILVIKKHSLNYTAAGRRLVVDRLVDVAKDPEVSKETSWTAYTIIRALFVETSRHTREQLMQEFIRRESPERALQVFNAMREHWMDEVKPTEETYLIALEGLHTNPSAVNMVWNQLKIDTRVDPSTKLWNTMMRVFAKVGWDEARGAVRFWDELFEMKEGPNEDSAVAVLQACGRSSVGQEQTKEVWRTVQENIVPVTERILGTYIGSLVQTDQFEEAQEALKDGVAYGIDESER